MSDTKWSDLILQTPFIDHEGDELLHLMEAELRNGGRGVALVLLCLEDRHSPDQ